MVRWDISCNLIYLGFNYHQWGLIEPTIGLATRFPSLRFGAQKPAVASKTMGDSGELIVT
jgi:hypothetical protein